MNAPANLSMKTDEVLRVELEVFRREHRDLDDHAVDIAKQLGACCRARRELCASAP